jgi:hypothetical protein
MRSHPNIYAEQTSYRFCKTRKVRLWAFWRGDKQKRITLRDKLGNELGTLHLHNKEQLEPFSKKTADHKRGVSGELVAIYESRVHSRVRNKKEVVNTNSTLKRDYYRVLWVEWDSDVAYGEASRKIRKEGWEGLDLTDMSLILG